MKEADEGQGRRRRKRNEEADQAHSLARGADGVEILGQDHLEGVAKRPP